MFKKKKKDDRNLMDLILIKKVDSKENAKGNVVLLIPKWQGRFSKKWIQPRLSEEKAYFKVNLDETGSTLWRLLDNKSTVHEIFLQFQNKSQIDEDPLNRYVFFVKQLIRNKFVELK